MNYVAVLRNREALDKYNKAFVEAPNADTTKVD